MWGEKKTKIVATLSDFRANEEFVRGLFEAGMDVVRINSAHVTEEGAAKIVEAVRRVNPAIPVILDTKGPEIRVTAVADEYGGAIGFQTGERVKVRGTADGEPSTRDTIYFNVATVVRDIAVGARLLIADGELELRVTDKTDEELMCEFVRGGTLRSRKSVNVPGMKIDLPSVTEKDRRFIEWAVKTTSISSLTPSCGAPGTCMPCRRFSTVTTVRSRSSPRSRTSRGSTTWTKSSRLRTG